MFYETILRVGLPVFLLTIASCSAPETVPMMPIGVTDVNGVGTARAESEESIGDASEVIISLSDKRLMMQRYRFCETLTPTLERR